LHYKTKPKYIFEISYDNDDSKNISFSKYKEQNSNDVTFAYHGSALENWHSICSNGLDHSKGKEGLFGEGIYLSISNSVAEMFLRMGRGWKKSMFSHTLGIIGHAEVINSKEFVKYVAKNPHSGEEKYIVVTNNNCVQLKHLLLFEGQVKETTRWNRCNLILMFYILILFIYGIFNSYYLKKSKF